MTKIKMYSLKQLMIIKSIFYFKTNNRKYNIKYLLTYVLLKVDFLIEC